MSCMRGRRSVSWNIYIVGNLVESLLCTDLKFFAEYGLHQLFAFSARRLRVLCRQKIVQPNKTPTDGKPTRIQLGQVANLRLVHSELGSTRTVDHRGKSWEPTASEYSNIQLSITQRTIMIFHNQTLNSLTNGSIRHPNQLSIQRIPSHSVRSHLFYRKTGPFVTAVQSARTLPSCTIITSVPLMRSGSTGGPNDQF